ncbi:MULTISPECIES: hypothetical protein [Sorangium]
MSATNLEIRFYRSQADRDAHMRSGMEAGMRETFARLAERLPTLS